MSYNNQAFSYVASQAQQIKAVATALNVSEAAIAGAMAEEHDSLLKITSIQLVLDAYAANNLPTHDSIVYGVKLVNSYNMADAKVGLLEKTSYPVLIDVGPANIKISTAVRLSRIIQMIS